MNDDDFIELLLQLVHQLSGPISAMSLDVATLDELLDGASEVGQDSDGAETMAALTGLKLGLDESIDRIHRVRSLLQQERDRRARPPAHVG